MNKNIISSLFLILLLNINTSVKPKTAVEELPEDLFEAYEGKANSQKYKSFKESENYEDENTEIEKSSEKLVKTLKFLKNSEYNKQASETLKESLKESSKELESQDRKEINDILRKLINIKKNKKSYSEQSVKNTILNSINNLTSSVKNVTSSTSKLVCITIIISFAYMNNMLTSHVLLDIIEELHYVVRWGAWIQIGRVALVSIPIIGSFFA